MDGTALGAGAPADALGPALGRLGPNDQAGADEDGAQATTLAATRPPPAMAAVCRNPRRLSAGGSPAGSRGGGAADPVWLGVGRAWGVVVSMRAWSAERSPRCK